MSQYYSYQQYDVNQYKVLDNEGMDAVGEFVTYNDARATVARYNHQLAMQRTMKDWEFEFDGGNNYCGGKEFVSCNWDDYASIVAVSKLKVGQEVTLFGGTGVQCLVKRIN